MRPNFLIIGAAKSGTTALFQYLAQHPEVFACEPKEPHFMAFAGTTPNFRGPYDDQVINRRATTTIEAYEKLFAGSTAARAVGEGSVSTLYYHDRSIANLKKYTPQARLLCILRNPIDRAFSAYMYLLSLTRETVQDFSRAWALEPERIAGNYHHIWHYQRMGLYSEQLEPFMRSFPPEQLKVLLYDDFRRNPLEVVKDCCRFLEIDPHYSFPTRPAPLVSGRPRNRLLQSLLGRPSALKQAVRKLLPGWLTDGIRSFISRRNLARESMSPEMRRQLADFYREDVRKLSDLLHCDLSPWVT